jgi:hypothetical protein
LLVAQRILVASVDGHVDDGERALVMKIGSAFQMSRARITAVSREEGPDGERTQYARLSGSTQPNERRDRISGPGP